MIRSRLGIYAIIAFALISNLFCQDENKTNQVPLLTSTQTNGTSGENGTPPWGTVESVTDGAIIDESSADTGTTSPAIITAAPSVMNLSTLVSRLPDGENAFFTETGRLFVTDGFSLSEITDRSTVRRLITDTSGMFGGIAKAGAWLYVLHMTLQKPLPAIDLNTLFASGDILTILQALSGALMKKELLRADLSAPGTPVFYPVHTLHDVVLPNGMAADADGNLYVADQTFLPGGKIIKLTVSAGNTPLVTQETWLSGTNGCSSPNGMVIRGNTLYFTDFVITSTKPAKVKKVDIINGRPGTVTTLYSAFSFFDDLDVAVYHGEPVAAVCDYLLNSIVLINLNSGVKTRLGSGSIANPSSVHFGAGPQFKTNELVITEKGILYEMYSTYGNKLSCMTLQ